MVRLLLVALLLVGCGSSPHPPVVVDELQALQGLDVAPLEARGANVVIILTRKPRELGKAGDSRLLAIYASLEPRHSELRAGSKFSEDLPPSRLERIRTEALNPALQKGDYRLAFQQTVAALEAELAIQAQGRKIVAVAILGLSGLWLLYAINPGMFSFLWARREAARERQRALQERDEARAELVKLGATLPEEATTAEIRAEVKRLKEVHYRAECLVEWRRRAYAALNTLKPRKKKKSGDAARYEACQAELAALEREASPDLLEKLICFTEEIVPTPARSYAGTSESTYESPSFTPPDTSSSYYNSNDYTSPGESQASGDW